MPETIASAPVTDARAVARHLARAARAEGPPWLHQEVARRMAQRLPVIRQAPEHWVDWWGFTGGGAPAVAAVWPQARRSVVEPTEALVERSRQALRAPWWAWGQRRRDAAQQVGLASDLPAGAAQMLWANLVLHSAPDPAALLAQWRDALAVDGFLMFSTFGPDTLRELRAVYAACGWASPHPPYADMHDLGDLLVHQGFADPVMDQEQLQLTWSSPQAMLAELGITPERLDEVQDVPVSRLLSAMADVQKRQTEAGRPSGFSPVVDGKILPTLPFDPVASPISETIPIMVGCTTHEQAFMVLGRDDAAFNLDEGGLRQRVVTLVGEANATRMIDAYKKVNPDKKLSEIYFLLATDRGMRMSSIRLA